jgi:hypothetical protein
MAFLSLFFSTQALGRSVTMKLGSYDWFDNGDNADIAYPGIHKFATEGLGSYADPVTFAGSKVSIYNPPTTHNSVSETYLACHVLNIRLYSRRVQSYTCHICRNIW